MNKLSILFFVALVGVPTFLFAGTSSHYATEIGSKLGRGIENIVTSPAEIPCMTEIEMHQGDPSLGFFKGLIKGTGLFLRRAVVGVAEVVTFFAPMKLALPRVCPDTVSPTQPSAQTE